MGKTLYEEVGRVWRPVRRREYSTISGPSGAVAAVADLEKLAETFRRSSQLFANWMIATGHRQPPLFNSLIPTLILLKGGADLRSEHELAQVLGRHTNGVVKQ